MKTNLISKITFLLTCVAKISMLYAQHRVIIEEAHFELSNNEIHLLSVLKNIFEDIPSSSSVEEEINISHLNIRPLAFADLLRKMRKEQSTTLSYKRKIDQLVAADALGYTRFNQLAQKLASQATYINDKERIIKSLAYLAKSRIDLTAGRVSRLKKTLGLQLLARIFSDDFRNHYEHTIPNPSKTGNRPVIFTSDGSRFVLLDKPGNPAYTYKEIAVYDRKTGNKLNHISIGLHNWCESITPDSRFFIFSAKKSDRLYRLALEEKARPEKFEKNPQLITYRHPIIICPSGNYCAQINLQGVTWWNIHTKKIMHSIQKNTRDGCCNSNTIGVGAHKQRKIITYDIESGECLETFSYKTISKHSHLQSITFDSKGKHLIASNKQTLFSINIATKKAKRIYSFPTAPAYLISAKNNLLATYPQWNRDIITVLDWHKKKIIYKFNTHNINDGHAVAFSNDGRLFATGCTSNTHAILWDAKKCSKISRITLDSSLKALKFTADDTTLLIATKKKIVEYQIPLIKLRTTISHLPLSAQLLIQYILSNKLTFKELKQKGHFFGVKDQVTEIKKGIPKEVRRLLKETQ